ncbi:hypothetical protein V6N12_008726 [Hibiscus sabdariffa]|uniref:3'(2'),5'-bisphosphate nucleotidase n=1 Tax=Hibiscus sabdariffa TaxID=183260 RepID=A0ABR2C3S6_9ROSI
MEDQRDLVVSPAGQETYAKELDVAVRVVQMACSLCQKVQDTSVHSKDDNSLVSVAVVQILSKADADVLLDAVVKTINDCLAEAPYFGLKGPETPLGSSDVLEAISCCNSTGGPTGRFWALGPIDSIKNGEVVVGVLGCPNYPMKKEWLTYQHRNHRILSKLAPSMSESWDKGCVIYARKGCGEAWIQPLHQKNKVLTWPNSAISVQASLIENPALAAFCDPVEKSNSTHSFTSGLAHSHGLRKQPVRVYSMAKYAAIARGDAEIFMKFTSTGNKEKIWDHAAGGFVTDAGGSPLDFSNGMLIKGLDRGIIACAAKLNCMKKSSMALMLAGTPPIYDQFYEMVFNLNVTSVYKAQVMV